MHTKLSLINEQTSPLFRIMSVYNATEQGKRQFENNTCAFHIGNGYILSVAHTLRAQAGYLRTIAKDIFTNDISRQLSSENRELLNRYYKLDATTDKYSIVSYDNKSLHDIASILKEAKFDTRWQILHSKGACTPFMILQFEEQAFYKNVDLGDTFNNRYLYDTVAAKHTYLIQVELVKAYYEEDISIYRMVGLSEELIAQIPTISVNTCISDIDMRLFCLQGSPANEAGRLLNSAVVEGLLDHTAIFSDPFEGDYTTRGLRYMVKGYFRFGSSGAPYLLYNQDTEQYEVNAIQSEASPIQLTINNSREGNFQFINAIATPLYNIRERLSELGFYSST